MLELETVVDIGAVEGFSEVFLRVDKVHHAKIDIIRVETGKEIPDERIAELHVAGAHLVFYAEFADEESLKKFMNHPLHVAHREKCKEIVTDRLCGDIVSE